MNGTPAPRVTIFGTGAMGCLVGARLARSGTAVTLVGTWREALAAVERDGIRLEDGSGAWAARVATVRLPDLVAPCPTVLVLAKSYQTRAIAPHVARAVSPGGVVVSLQNGLGNRDELAACIAHARVAVGVVTAGASVLAPGRVSGHPGSVTLEAGSPPSAALAALAERLRAAGFETELTSDVERLVWRKLVVNCAINPLSVLRGTPNGALLERAEDRDQLALAAREVAAVARARGIELDGDPAEMVFEVARLTAGNRSSMLQDVERGAPTELAALNGAVIREGRRLGVPTPVNEELRDAVLRLTTAAAPAALPA